MGGVTARRCHLICTGGIYMEVCYAVEDGTGACGGMRLCGIKHNMIRDLGFADLTETLYNFGPFKEGFEAIWKYLMVIKCRRRTNNSQLLDPCQDFRQGRPLALNSTQKPVFSTETERPSAMAACIFCKIIKGLLILVQLGCYCDGSSML